MERTDLIEALSSGIAYSSANPWEAVEYLLEKRKTTDKKIVFSAYDSNLCPLPNFSTWNPDYRKQQTEFVLKSIRKRLGDNVASRLKIQVDDVVIQG